MQKILLMSDTHGYIDDNMLEYCKEADEVWHAGDIGSYDLVDEIEKVSILRGVYGNIDGAELRKEFPLDNIFTLEKVKVFLTHIGGYPGRYDKRVRYEILKNKPKLFISGHSHILKVQYDKKHNLLHMNPGAAGKYGFHKVRTMLRFILDGGDIKELEVIELRKN